MSDHDKKELIEHLIKEVSGVISDDDFQSEFFDSLADQYVVRGWLSEKQIDALKRIYERLSGV